MKKNTILLLLFLTGYACNAPSVQSNERLLKIMGDGTDSTIIRFYKEGKIQETQTKYYGALLTTTFKYNSTNGNLTSISSTLIDDKFGHYFEFNDDGKLLNYSFFIGKENFASYVENTDTNGITTIKGTPFVASVRDLDNKSIDLFFTTVPFEKIEVAIASPKNKKYKELRLKQSGLMPMLMECNTANNDSVIFIRVSGVDETTLNRKTYYDTAFVNFVN